MVVHRDGSHKGKLGKKIARTLAAGIVVPGLLGGQLAMSDNLASADMNELILESIPNAPITLQYGQRVYFDQIIEQNEIYKVRVSSSHISDSDLESANFKPEQPGTYTVYLYDTYSNYYNNLNAFATFDVILPYPDANLDGIIDISDIVKYMKTYEYDSEIRKEILGWTDSSHKAVNVAPTINSAFIFDPHFYVTCSNSHSLENLFNDEDKSSLKYSIVGNIPATMNAVISGEYFWDASNYVNVWQDAINYVVHDYGTSTITVRATDKYGKFADRPITFDGYSNFDYYEGEPHIWDVEMGESEVIVNISTSVVNNSPKDIGSFVNPEAFEPEEGSGAIYLRLDNVEYVDGIAKAVIRVDVTTVIGEEPGHTYTHYFKIIAYEVY